MVNTGQKHTANAAKPKMNILFVEASLRANKIADTRENTSTEVKNTSSETSAQTSIQTRTHTHSHTADNINPLLQSLTTGGDTPGSELTIDTPRLQGSISRHIAGQFARHFIKQLLNNNKGSQLTTVNSVHDVAKTGRIRQSNPSSNNEINLIYRDIAAHPPALITQDWVTAAFAEPDVRTQAQTQWLQESDTLIAEVAAADLILLSTPMYNYGMPAHLKAWFDNVVRVNKTFSFDLARGDFPLQPLLGGKTMVLVTSAGEFGFEAGGVRDGMDHLTPHCRVLSRYLGVTHFHHLAAEYQEFADQRHQDSVQRALADAKALSIELANRLAN